MFGKTKRSARAQMTGESEPKKASFKLMRFDWQATKLGKLWISRSKTHQKNTEVLCAEVNELILKLETLEKRSQ